VERQFNERIKEEGHRQNARSTARSRLHIWHTPRPRHRTQNTEGWDHPSRSNWVRVRNLAGRHRWHIRWSISMNHDQPCNACGGRIDQARGPGRPRLFCASCRPPVKKTLPEHLFGPKYYNRVCQWCESPIERTGLRGRPPSFCPSCASQMAAYAEDYLPF